MEAGYLLVRGIPKENDMDDGVPSPKSKKRLLELRFFFSLLHSFVSLTESDIIKKLKRQTKQHTQWLQP